MSASSAAPMELHSGTKYLTPFSSYSHFKLHPSKRGVSEELYLFHVHEPTSTEKYLACLSHGDHVLDVGSNIGYYAVLAADKVGRTGRVIGCEPSPGVFEILKQNVQRFDPFNVEVFPWAVGAKSREPFNSTSRKFQTGAVCFRIAL